MSDANRASAGDRPSRESHASPPEPSASTDEDLLAALADEFADRVRRGERVSVGDYAVRHPHLAERIRGVLSAIGAIEDACTIDTTSPGGDAAGTMIGRYKLLERIGEGGFGVVYMAEQQQPVRRRVALKVVKPGMDSRQVLNRFEAERQALAIMDHPNIARVFDGGLTELGRPYFVMELVRGEAITDFCDRNQLSPRQRLELFEQVCQAVQHAHQKGVIHRDIKPSNVLVTVHDTKPVVKVIDFGVAKALGQELTDKTLFTGFAQLVGTPLYMSPEQAGESSLDVDTRSDIYSLGVLLYELLTGTTPFDKERFRRAAQDEIRRIIREEEPPRPSTRLSESKDRLPSISAQRHTEPAKLARLVRGELDWIVMKALEKDRNRRYETANGLAADVRRYLANEAVLACPPSTAYRLRKFAGRNQRGLAVASLILVCLMALGGGVGWVARDRTARQARVTQQVEQILSEVAGLQEQQKWPEALAEARRAETLVSGDNADPATVQRVGEHLKDLNFIDRLEQVRMQFAMWYGREFDYNGVNQNYAQLFREYGVDVDQLPIETSIGRLNSRPATVIAVGAALDHWSSQRLKLGDVAGRERLAAIARGIDADAMRCKLRSAGDQSVQPGDVELKQLSESIDLRKQRPATLTALAIALKQANQKDAAIKLLTDAQSQHPDDFWINYNLAASLNEQGDYEGAVRYGTAAVAIRPDATPALNNLGNALRNHGKVDQAITMYRRAIEVDPSFAFAYNGLGIALVDQKELILAEAAYRKAMEVDPGLPHPYANLGNIYCDYRGEYDTAIELFKKVIDLDPNNPLHYCSLGIALDKQGKHEQALQAFQSAIEIDPNYADAYRGVGNAWYSLRDWTKAIDAYRQAIAVNREFPKVTARDDLSASLYHRLCTALHQQKKFDEAIKAINQAIDLEPRSAVFQNELANALLALKKTEDAMVAYRRAIEFDPTFPNAHNGLGNCLAALGRTSEAIAAYKKAIELDPREPGHYHNLGLKYIELQQYQDAVECFTKVIESRSKQNLAAAHYNLAQSYMGLQQVGKAIPHYRMAMQLEPNNAQGPYALGTALRAANKPREAADAFRKVIELVPTDPGAYITLGALLCDDLHDYAAAEAYLEKAVELAPINANAHSNYGVSLRGQKKYDAAVVSFRKAIELDPHHTFAHAGLAKTLAGQRKFADAIAAYEDALDVDPGPAHHNLARLLTFCSDSKYRDYPRAVPLARQAVELDPDNPEYLTTLGVAEYRTDNLQAAVDALSRAASLREVLDIDDSLFLAMAHARLGNLAEAERCYRQADNRFTNNPSQTQYLLRLRDQAAKLIGITPATSPSPSTAPAASRPQTQPE